MSQDRSFCLNKTTCPIFFPLHLPVKHVVMSVARDTLLNLRIQTVVTFLERKGKDKDSGDSNVGANLYRLLKARKFFLIESRLWELVEIHEDKGYVTGLPRSRKKIRSSLLYQLDSEQRDLAVRKSVQRQKWKPGSLKACVRGWMGTRIFMGSTRKFKKTWQKIFRWNGVRRGKELNAKYDYVIMNRNGWVAWRCLLFQRGTKESSRLSWQEQGHKARHSLHQNRKGIKRELAKATYHCVLPGQNQQVKQAVHCPPNELH